MKSTLHNQNGEKIGEVELEEKVFNRKINPDHLYQAILYYQNLNRKQIAKTKDRSEVRGGGKKPWRQKGTGRARHGSIRSPIWKGGGVTFGPTTEKNYKTKLSKKAKKTALSMAFSQKLKDNEIIIVDRIELENFKTKSAEKLIKNFEKEFPKISNKKILIVLAKKNEKIQQAFKNIKNIQVCPVNSLNAYLLLKNKYIILEKQAIKNKISG